jgi:hypothetical protein
VAFPILLANLTGELLGGSTAPTEAILPGAPVELVIPAGARSVTVTPPDGTAIELVPGAAGGATVTYASTGTPGIYTVTPNREATASPGTASGAPSPSPASPSASAAASGSSAPGSAPPADPFAPQRFAVDLFDVNESTIAPASAAALEALGTIAGASAAPGASAVPSTGGAAATERPTTRDELWIPIVLIVLIALSLEWALYHRDALVRIRRAVVVRLGRAPDGGTG